jgi:hypothetical protein
MHLGEKSSELVALRVLGFNQRTVSKNDTGTRMQQSAAINGVGHK